MVKTIAARQLIADESVVEYPVVTVEDGRIVAIEAGAKNDSTETLAAPFFDIHVHGARSRDFMTATGAEIEEVGLYLASRGVGRYLPTTVTGPMDATLRALERLAEAIEAGRERGSGEAATPVGIHLEGPFVSHAKRGVHPAASIQAPSVAVFERMQEAARGEIRLMTLAPELPEALELVRAAVAQGVRVTMGHSNATLAETERAIAAGATSATHLFNAMRAMDHREPGIAGTILQAEDVYAEAICDGVHVHPAMLRVWMKMKGERRAILVTDGMSATGMPDGTYTLGDFDVQVRDGVCLLGETLAGSVLTMDRAVENVQRFTGVGLATAVRLGSRNPAAMLGMSAEVALEVGARADFNVFDGEGRMRGRIRGGQRVA